MENDSKIKNKVKHMDKILCKIWFHHYVEFKYIVSTLLR